LGVHQSIESEDRHIPILDLEYDLESVFLHVSRQMRRRWQEVVQFVKVDDPDWGQAVVSVFQVQLAQALGLLLPSQKRKSRLQLDERALQDIEDAVVEKRVEDLPTGDLSLGFVEKGGDTYLVMSYGSTCVLINYSFVERAIHRGFIMSIRGVKVHRFSLGSLSFRLEIAASKIWYLLLDALSL
jgi:hypothetical protein